jgi:hypothetical protein
MIDSTILDRNHKNYDINSNLSRSNLGSMSNYQLKTG